MEVTIKKVNIVPMPPRMDSYIDIEVAFGKVEFYLERDFGSLKELGLKYNFEVNDNNGYNHNMVLRKCIIQKTDNGYIFKGYK
jgi:hypothetical protein